MALFESYERREKQILAVIKEYGINSIPCFILFENGQEKGRAIGVQDKARLLAALNA